MSPNNQNVPLTENGGFIAYIVHSMSDKDLGSFWSAVKCDDVAKAIAVSSLMKTQSSADPRNMASSSSSAIQLEDSSNPNGRFKWTEYFDRRLLIAIHSLHPANRKPKEILKLMNDVPGLNRVKINSRLQKLKKCRDSAKNKQKSSENTKMAKKPQKKKFVIDLNLPAEEEENDEDKEEEEGDRSG